MGTQPTLAARPDNLALVYQEVFTAIERLRSGRQPVTDAELFRNQILEALRLADQEARGRGYTAEETKLCVFALVAFLDESILNLQWPVFANWPRKPLQEQLFGVHVAGEIYFQNIQRLLASPDAPNLADVLEVYLLCLLLGFRGRYGIGGQAELRSIMAQLEEKIRRIRGFNPLIASGWGLPQDAVAAPQGDPWLKTFVIAAAACLGLAVILFAGYSLMLGSAVSDLAALR